MIPICKNIKNTLKNFLRKEEVNGNPLGSNDNVLRMKGNMTGNFNNYTDTGFYIVDGSAKSNAPSGVSATWCFLLVFKMDSSYSMQFIIDLRNNYFYMREMSGVNAVWTSWKKITLS